MQIVCALKPIKFGIKRQCFHPKLFALPPTLLDLLQSQEVILELMKRNIKNSNQPI